MNKDDNALRKLAEQTKKITKEELQERSNMLKPLFEDVDEEIRESSFIKYFLPLIAKAVPVNEENIQRFIKNIKIVTGSPHRGLKVIDDNTGEELFRLPPILLSLDSGEGLLETFSFSTLIRKQLLAEENPLSTLNNEVKKAMSFIESLSKPDREQLNRYLNGIIAMYKRYGLADVNVSVKTENNNRQLEDIGDLLDLD